MAGKYRKGLRRGWFSPYSPSLWLLVLVFAYYEYTVVYQAQIDNKTSGDPDVIQLVVKSSHCPKPEVLGSGSEGGWFVCDPAEVRAQAAQNACVVYSYGIRDNFSFDQAIHALGCQVHGFDPSKYGLASKPQYEALGGVYHSMGLGLFDGTVPSQKAPFRWPGIGYLKETNSDPWVLQRVSTTMKGLGHARLTFLKVDAEGAEWDAVYDIVHNVDWDQFAAELHFSPKEFMLQIIGENHNIRAVTISRIPGEKQIEPAEPAYLDRIPLLRELLQVADVWKIVPNYADSCCINAYFKRKKNQAPSPHEDKS